METRGEKSRGGQEVVRAGDSSSIADCTLKEKPAPEGQSKDYGPEDLGQSSIGCFERQCNPVAKIMGSETQCPSWNLSSLAGNSPWTRFSYCPSLHLFLTS